MAALSVLFHVTIPPCFRQDFRESKFENSECPETFKNWVFEWPQADFFWVKKGLQFSDYSPLFSPV